MKPLATALALSSALGLAACAHTPSTGTAGADEHAAHRAAPAALASPAAPSAMQERMKAMQVMRDRMGSATTPAERMALMDEHMVAIHGGMAAMNGMQPMPMDPAHRQHMLEMRMDMMQTMLDMMMQRMHGSPTPAAR